MFRSPIPRHIFIMSRWIRGKCGPIPCHMDASPPIRHVKLIPCVCMYLAKRLIRSHVAARRCIHSSQPLHPFNIETRSARLTLPEFLSKKSSICRMIDSIVWSGQYTGSAKIPYPSRASCLQARPTYSDPGVSTFAMESMPMTSMFGCDRECLQTNWLPKWL